MLSSWSGISARELPKATDKVDLIAEKAVEAIGQTENFSFTIYDSTNKFENIANEIRRKAIREEVDVVYIDYLTLMRPS